MAKKRIIPITKPTTEPFSAYAPLFKESLASGMLTNAKHVSELETQVARYLGVKHVIAVSSCTAGLMLVFKGLGLKGEVIMPSFTFLGSGHALLWNGITPVFVDIDPRTYTLDPKLVEKAITKNTSAIFSTHVFGAVADTNKLRALAKKHKLKLIYDAAHAFGSAVGTKKAGAFGDVEVFSMSPTKVLTAAEGGLVATNDDALAAYVRLGRNYGDDGQGSAQFGGLSARLSEFNAAIALRSFRTLEKNLALRNVAAARLIEGFLQLEPRLRFQRIPKGSTTTFKDLSLYVDPILGYTRDDLHAHFATHGVMTRKYFSPPVHKQPAYKEFAQGVSLPVTEEVSVRVLSLPLYAHISRADQERIIKTFKQFLHDRKKS